MNIRKYTHGNFRYGDIEFSNDCNGGDFFGSSLKDIFLHLSLLVFTILV